MNSVTTVVSLEDTFGFYELSTGEMDLVCGGVDMVSVGEAALKGAVLGGVSGAVGGAVTGSMAGGIGAAPGAAAGAVGGAITGAIYEGGSELYNQLTAPSPQPTAPPDPSLQDKTSTTTKTN